MKTYPSVASYSAAILSGGALKTLTYLYPVKDKFGQPFSIVGSKSVVFKMNNPLDGYFYALKCFTTHREGRYAHYKDVYGQIESLPGIYPLDYFEQGIEVDSLFYPVLLTRWIDDENMAVELERLTYQSKLNRRSAIEALQIMETLAQNFDKMALSLLSLGVTFVDWSLQSMIDNSLYSIIPVDYDNLYVLDKIESSAFVNKEQVLHTSNQLMVEISLLLHNMVQNAKNESALAKIDERKLSDKNESLEIIAALYGMQSNSVSNLYNEAETLSKIFTHNIALYDRLCENVVEEGEQEEYVENFKRGYYSTDRIKLHRTKPTLKKYSIISTTEVICNNAFACNKVISKIEIPESVVKIGVSAFVYCDSLQSIKVSPENCHYKDIDGVLFDKQGTTLIKYPQNRPERSYSIPYGVAAIERGAFEDCKNLTSIHLPDGVTHIKCVAFNHCENLVSINIPPSVVEIERGAFNGCYNQTSIGLPNKIYRINEDTFGCNFGLKSIEIPLNITQIEDKAFFGCRDLNSIYISQNVERLGYQVFGFSRGLSHIEVSDQNKNFSSIDGVLFNYDKTVLVKFPPNRAQTTYAIPETVVQIGAYAFENCGNLSKIIFPNGLKQIGEHAFAFCDGLKSVDIPDGLIEIWGDVFWYCENLESVVWPKNLINRGER